MEKVSLKDNAFSSSRITSPKNLDDKFMNIEVDEELQKKQSEGQTIVKEGNLSSTVKSYKSSALDRSRRYLRLERRRYVIDASCGLFNL